MATKTINIKESAYQALLAMKHEGESFSDVILRLTQPEKRSVTDFIRALPPDLKNELAESALEAKKELDRARPRKVAF